LSRARSKKISDRVGADGAGAPAPKVLIGALLGMESAGDVIGLFLAIGRISLCGWVRMN